MGKLYVLRQRLPSDVPFLGVSATLTKDMTDDVLESCGFRLDTKITRHTIYRAFIKFHLEATSDVVVMQKRVVQTIIRKGRERHGQALSPISVPKAIFYVKTNRDTVYVRSSIIEWFREFGIPGMDQYVCMFHSELTDATKSRIQKDFGDGRVRVIVCTIAYGVGVNPPGVEFVCQSGRCSMSEAIQKAAKGGRRSGGAEVGAGPMVSYFFWFVDPRIIGERAGRASALWGLSSSRQTNARRVPARLQSLLPGSGSDTDNSDSSVGSDISTAPRSRSKRHNNASAQKDAEWRATKAFEGEWELWNRARCYRSTILLPFLEKLGEEEDAEYRCGGCSRCCKDGEILANLDIGLPNDGVDEHVKKVVMKMLEKLRKEIGNELAVRSPKHPIVVACPDDPGSLILTDTDIKQFSRRYPAVRRGNLFNWIWSREYGDRVIGMLRQYVHGSPEPETLVTGRVDPGNSLPTEKPLQLLAAAAISASQTAIGLPIGLPNTPLPRLSLDDITNSESPLPRTARGSIAKRKRKGDGQSISASPRKRDLFNSSPRRGA
jgi:hypothetical protein